MISCVECAGGVVTTVPSSTPGTWHQGTGGGVTAGVGAVSQHATVTLLSLLCQTIATHWAFKYLKQWWINNEYSYKPINRQYAFKDLWFKSNLLFLECFWDSNPFLCWKPAPGTGDCKMTRMLTECWEQHVTWDTCLDRNTCQCHDPYPGCGPAHVPLS